MTPGELTTTGMVLWLLVVAGAGALTLRGRVHALRRFGERAFKERRAALLVVLVPIVSFALTVALVGDGALAGEGAAPAPGPPTAWRGVALWLMLGNALGVMVSCALMVLGMLRDTTTGRVLLADVMTAVAGLFSLWAVASSFPQPV